MFASLKNKIKEETGSDPAAVGVPHHRFVNNSRMRSRVSSTISVNSNCDLDTALNAEKHQQQMVESQLASLRSQCNELTTKVTELTNRLEVVQDEKTRIEKTNEILLETVKVAQGQKDFYCEEQEKIQNMQHKEIEKLKNLLVFREQEAVDRAAALKQQGHQMESLTLEVERLQMFELNFENIKDEYEKLSRSSILEKNNLTTTLAAVEEENRNLKTRLQMVNQSRVDVLKGLNADEKVKALVQEHKLLEQHLEEAHLQLSDIKSSWSGQNMALETQVSRLSKQVAEETTEKRKVIKAFDDLKQKVEKLEFELSKSEEQIKHRDEKIKLLEDEVEELNNTLKDCREENEQQILYERNKVESIMIETNALKSRLQTEELHLAEFTTNSEQITNELKRQVNELKEQLNNTQNNLEIEKQEKVTALLRSAEISQSEEILKRELRLERDEANELQHNNSQLTEQLTNERQELIKCRMKIDELKAAAEKFEEKVLEIENLQKEISEKDNTIRLLNQRLTDLKKILKKEFHNCQQDFEAKPIPQKINSVNGDITTASCTDASMDYIKNSAVGGIVMDEVSFKYLKHVIVKFLTSREVESKHLVRVIATLLKLSKDEEKLLHDTIGWKMSWFGSKPENISGKHTNT